MNHVTETTHCRACGTRLPAITVFTLGTMPVVSFPEVEDAPQIYAPVDLVECTSCTLVQLRHTVDPDVMFRKFWYRSGCTESMRSALRDIVESAMRLVTLKPCDFVCDIGCNDGTLLSLYPDGIYRVGFEPSDVYKSAKEKGISVIPDYFRREFLMGPGCLMQGTFKVITAIAMFYDLQDPGTFLDDVKWALAPGGIFIVQMNYLCSMLQHYAVDNIEHEHLTYYSAESFCRLAQKHGFSVFHIEENQVNGGSIRFYLAPLDSPPPFFKQSNVEEFIDKERPYVGKGAWMNFENGIQSVRWDLNSYRMGLYGQKQMAICGASTRGLALLHYLKLGCETFCCAGDRDTAKHGRFYGATGIPIVSEEDARRIAKVMLVLPYHFKREIIEREWLTSGGELVFPLPRPSVVTKDGERGL